MQIRNAEKAGMLKSRNAQEYEIQIRRKVITI
jgi:hypothetical protein